MIDLAFEANLFFDTEYGFNSLCDLYSEYFECDIKLKKHGKAEDILIKLNFSSEMHEVFEHIKLVFDKNAIVNRNRFMNLKKGQQRYVVENYNVVFYEIIKGKLLSFYFVRIDIADQFINELYRYKELEIFK